MENNQKPEWFELADNDQIVSRKSKSKVSASKRNLTFILAGILVIPLGAGLGLLSLEDQSAITAAPLGLTQDSPVVASSATSQPYNTISLPTGSRDDDDDEEEGDDEDRAPIFSSTAPSVTAPVAPLAPAAIAPPASASSSEIILPPTKKADDDDDDDDDDEDDDDDDDDDEDDDDDDDDDEEDDD